MKKLLYCTLLFCIVFISCDPPQYSWQWMITNKSEQTLKLNYIAQSGRVSPAYGIYTIPQGQTFSLYGVTAETGKRHRMYWWDYFAKSAASYGEDVYWQLLSEDDVVLKTWKYSDKGLPDQRFFEESSWTFDQKPGSGAFIEMEYTWTFDILPEDIQPTEQ